MNWEAIGAVGEIIGAIAVFITLIYLAMQIRQNTKQLSENEKALHRSEMNTLMQNWSDLRRAEMSDSSLAEVLARARTDYESLSDADMIRHTAHTAEIFWINYQLWLRVQDNIFPSEQWESARHIVLENMQVAGGLNEWQRLRRIFNPDFVRDIESAREKGPADA